VPTRSVGTRVTGLGGISHCVPTRSVGTRVTGLGGILHCVPTRSVGTRVTGLGGISHCVPTRSVGTRGNLASLMPVSYPLITPTERKRATLRAIPARCTTFTTRSTSL